MKKSICFFAVCAAALALIISVSSTTVLALQAEGPEDFEQPEDIDLASYFTQRLPDESFAGVYYDENTLVVNYVGSYDHIAQVCGITDEKSNVEYCSVQYSLKMLESVKEYLEAVMGQYGIVVLDANEMTNQVDVSLVEFHEDCITDITNLVEDQFGCSECLNFIDAGEVVIQSTVAYEYHAYGTLGK